MIVADGWYAVGPALVIAALADGAATTPRGASCCSRSARRSPSTSSRPSLREYLGAGISPAELLPVLALVYLIDALLAPIGFLAVLASDVHEYAYLLAIAPGALLGLIARERSGADRARAGARARVPALDARARRPRRGPAPPGRPAAARRRVARPPPARTARRSSGSCSRRRSRRCRPTAGA